MSEPADVPALPIQAAFRGHRDRTQLEAKRSWMADVAQGDALTPRALGDVNGETGSRPRALLGVDASAARNDARSRAAASRAAKAGTRESSEAHSKTLGKNARSQPPTRGQVRAGAKAPGAQKAELAATKQLREFFDQAMRQAKLLDPSNSDGCCVSDVWISAEKQFAFVEVRTVQVKEPYFVCILH